MYKKIAIIGISALLLGGCTLTDLFKTNTAVNDVASPMPAATTTPAPSPSEDPELKAIPSTTPANDDKSLETDINSTTILKEDFSNLNK